MTTADDELERDEEIESLDDADGEPGKTSEGDGVARGLDADSILDALVPKSIDWRSTVSRHPMASVAAVGLVGYLVGRTKGSAIVAGATTGLSAALMRQLSDVFEGDYFDFD